MNKKFDLNRWIFEIPLEDIRSEDYEETGSDNDCICCGKPIKNVKFMVHLLTNGNLVSSIEDFDNSQGAFPIGNTCKNKLPDNFYFENK